MINTIFEEIKKWYLRNLGKIVFLFLVTVFFTVTIMFIPYLNILLGSSVGILISLVTFYLLFPPPTKVLAYISVIVLFFAYIFVVLQLNFMAELMGNLLFLLLVFIAINYGKSFSRKE